MSERESPAVTMRVRVGDNEIEVTGPATFVERKIREFLERQAHESHQPTRGAPSQPGQQSAPAPVAGKAISIAQFFKKAGARSDVGRALAAGYYLEKYQNAETFTSAEIASTIRLAKVPPPTNPSDAINKNIKKGLMMNAGDKDGRMAFVLTSDGEDAITEMLRA